MRSDISRDAVMSKLGWVYEDERIDKGAIIRGGDLILMK